MRKFWPAVGSVCVVMAVACGSTERDRSSANGGFGGGPAGEGGSRSTAMGGAMGVEVGGASDAGAPGAEEGGRAGDGGHPGVDACSSEQQPAFQPRCATPTFSEGTSTCGEEVTREILQCGLPGSNFDARCCARPSCADDADCGSGAHCLPALTQSPISDNASQFESCRLVCGDCECIGKAIDGLVSHCVIANSRLDCDVSGRSCDILGMWAETLAAIGDAESAAGSGGGAGAVGAAGAEGDSTFQIWGDPPPHFVRHVRACAAKVEAARAANCAE